MRYIDADLVEQIRDAFRKHVPLSDISRRTGIDADSLRELLGITEQKPVRGDRETGIDLWAADELDAQL